MIPLNTVSTGYSEYAPPRDLAAWIYCVWTFCSSHDLTPQHIAPDGRPEMIVHLGSPYLEQQGEERMTQPTILFAGQLTEPLTIVAQAHPDVIAVRFHAWAARAFLNASATSSVNKRLDLAHLHGQGAVMLRTALQETSDENRRVELICAYVRACLSEKKPDAVLQDAVMRANAGQALIRPAAMTERQWQRRFSAEIGISPRAFQSVLRFRRVFDAIDRPQTQGWVEAALTAGYFDQPQMARDFRRFLGVSAREWARQRVGLATALAASETYKNDV
jgi:AraC-like DNA-binding protein